MNRFRFNIEKLRVTFAVGFVGGVAMVLALAPAPPAPPDVPASRAYRPNISKLELPRQMNFCGETIPLDDPEVRKRMDREFLLNLQSDGQIMLYLKRSGEFFQMFDSILTAQGAPADLKYLSVAESALFQSQSGKGAVGLWQFIPETGRRYGLRIDEYVDERRNPEKSTAAGVRYLRDNFNRFKSWSLAAAAYNQGEAATDDDLRFQNGETYFDLYLNEETSRYLFRIAAIKEIMSNPEKYGFHLDRDDYYRPIPSRTVTVTEDIPNLANWAEANGSTYKMVKLANPWILKRMLPKPSAGQPYQIKVPIKG